MHTSEGSAAVSHEGDAPTPRDRVSFLDEQLSRARNDASVAALAFSMACHRPWASGDLDAAAHAACAALAEFRMALQARTLAGP